MEYSQYQNVPTFSQRYELREVPGPPQLEEISAQARNNLWGALWRHLRNSAISDFYGTRLVTPWRTVLESVHQGLMGRPLDDFDPGLGQWQRHCKSILLRHPRDNCFDLLETLIRHPACPMDFTKGLKEIFHYQLAYRIDTTSIPTIVPAATEQEGDALIGAIHNLADAGLGGAAEHLRQAGERIRDQDWAGSVRASIDAGESAAKQVTPGNADTLGKALAVLERQQGLHGALKSGFSSLYGYASDEPGVRHALLNGESKVTQDEAIYMIGACAAFCSYLWRKFGSADASSRTRPH